MGNGRQQVRPEALQRLELSLDLGLPAEGAAGVLLSERRQHVAGSVAFAGRHADEAESRQPGQERGGPGRSADGFERVEALRELHPAWRPRRPGSARRCPGCAQAWKWGSTAFPYVKHNLPRQALRPAAPPTCQDRHRQIGLVEASQVDQRRSHRHMHQVEAVLRPRRSTFERALQPDQAAKASDQHGDQLGVPETCIATYGIDCLQRLMRESRPSVDGHDLCSPGAGRRLDVELLARLAPQQRRAQRRVRRDPTGPRIAGARWDDDVAVSLSLRVANGDPAADDDRPVVVGHHGRAERRAQGVSSLGQDVELPRHRDRRCFLICAVLRFERGGARLQDARREVADLRLQLAGTRRPSSGCARWAPRWCGRKVERT